MDANLCGEIDVFRLVEAADEIARLEHRTQHRGRVPRIRAEIAVAQAMRGKKRRSAGEIKDDVAARSQAVARSLEDERIARGGAGGRIVVDCQLEGPQMALSVADRSLDDRERCRRRRRYLRRLCDHDRHVEMIGKQLACFDRNFVAAVDQDHPFAR